MGPYLSKVIKKKLADDPLSPTHASQDYDSTQEKLDSPNGNAASGSIPQSPKSQTGSSKKYELKPAHVNTSVAKTWNPNDPKSWEPEMREYHSLPTSDYMLPNDATEQDRLEMQHYIYRAAFGGDIVCPIVNDLIKLPGYKILDVGCAKGFWLKQLQKISPDAEYHGVDISKTLVEQFAEEGVSLKFGNVLETLPYEDNTFDFVHQRLLVLGMPRQKFPEALKELIRVTKPGGWIELVEADIVIYNAGPYSQTLTTAAFDGMHRRGLDCYAATNLPFYVKQVAASIENQQNKMIHASIGWGSNMGILAGADVKAVFLGLEDWMHKAMRLSREEYRELVQGSYAEWPKHKSFVQARALYFQVKK